MLLIGCAHSSSVTCTSLGGKDAYIASLSKKPYFAIITDGDVSGGVSNTIFIGAKYEGRITNSSTGEEYCFKAKGNKFYMADQEHEFNRGCVFLVSTRGKLDIQIAHYTEAEKLASLAASDKKITTFFER